MPADRLQNFHMLALQELGPNPLKEDPHSAILSVPFHNRSNAKATQALGLVEKLHLPLPVKIFPVWLNLIKSE
jgi:hypothetical protein